MCIGDDGKAGFNEAVACLGGFCRLGNLGKARRNKRNRGLAEGASSMQPSLLASNVSTRRDCVSTLTVICDSTFSA